MYAHTYTDTDNDRCIKGHFTWLTYKVSHRSNNKAIRTSWVKAETSEQNAIPIQITKSLD